MTKKLKVPNYVKLDCFSIFRYQYVYVDTGKYLADQLFINHKVRVKFGREMATKDVPYRYVFCKVRKKDEKNFLSALAEIYDKALLMGYSEYEKYCDLLLQEVTSAGEEGINDEKNE